KTQIVYKCFEISLRYFLRILDAKCARGRIPWIGKRRQSLVNHLLIVLREIRFVDQYLATHFGNLQSIFREFRRKRNGTNLPDVGGYLIPLDSISSSGASHQHIVLVNE